MSCNRYWKDYATKKIAWDRRFIFLTKEYAFITKGYSLVCIICWMLKFLIDMQTVIHSNRTHVRNTVCWKRYLIFFTVTFTSIILEGSKKGGELPYEWKTSYAQCVYRVRNDFLKIHSKSIEIIYNFRFKFLVNKTSQSSRSHIAMASKGKKPWSNKR